jgi:hypothetical protein
MKLAYSVNQYDKDGDCYEECIMIWIDDKFLLKFNNLNEYDEFIDKLKWMRGQIVETWYMENEG